MSEIKNGRLDMDALNTFKCNYLTSVHIKR